MIKISDALRLASKKLRIKKLANIFNLINIATGLILVLVLLNALAGFQSFIKKAFKDTLKGQKLAEISYAPICGGDICVTAYGKDVKPEKLREYGLTVKDELRSTTKDYYVLEGFENVINKDRIYFEDPLGIYPLATAPDYLLADYFASDDTFAKRSDGKIPIIVPQRLLQEKVGNIDSLPAKEAFTKTKNEYDLVRDKTVKLTRFNYEDFSSEKKNYEPKKETLKTEFQVVGLKTNSLMLFSFAVINDNFYLPQWAIEENTELKTLFANEPKNRIILEYESEKKFNEFMTSQLNVGPNDEMSVKDEATGLDLQKGFPALIKSNYETVAEVLKFLQKVIFGLTVFILAIAGIFLFFSLSKTVSESIKEIGVFRSFGARGLDIVLIYFSYIFILVFGGFILAFFVSLLTSFILSKYFSDSAYYAVMNFATNWGAEKPTLLLLGFPWLEYLLVFIVTNLTGVLSAVIPLLRAVKITPLAALKDE